MKKILTTILIVVLLVSIIPNAYAVSLQVDSKPVNVSVSMINSTSYVPLRATSLLLSPSANITWENNQAVIRTSNLTIAARPGSYYLDANGRMLYINDGIKLINGTTMVPVRVLAKAFGASVSWDGATQRVAISSGSGTITAGSQYYDSDSLYWLSRIINAESNGESLKGKIAVGDVILNRVASPDFPSTIHDVIFDDKWGVQFTPVSNGTINNTPSEESILAAKLCLDGASVVGSSLYFLNPSISTSSWIANNRSYVTTLGNHVFYA